ncbi:Dirigent protein 9 [Dionaea muscipula]
MANSPSLATTINPIMYILLLTITFWHADSARILDETDLLAPIVAVPAAGLTGSPAADVPVLSPVESPASTFPSGQIPATLAPVVQPQPIITTSPPAPAPLQPTGTGTSTSSTSTSTGSAPLQPTASATSTSTTGESAGPVDPAISFFMHDVLGGSHATGRVVTGIVATSAASGIPFSKPNSQVFPVNSGGGALLSGNINNIINNNNAPFLTGLNGQQTSSIIQNAGTNSAVNGGNNNNQLLPFVSAGQLPQGATLQKLMFGSITVIDDQLTEGQELDSAVVGEAQGFYLASSLDGQSHTMAFTAIFHGSSDQQDVAADTISFLGVHRTASPESQIAVIGGTGKYENAKGYATIVTLPQVDQHTTDGVDTLVQVIVYLYV